MDPYNMIRAGIFFTAGLIILVFPDSVRAFQDKVIFFFFRKKIIRSMKNKEFVITAIVFWVIALGLFIYSVNN